MREDATVGGPVPITPLAEWSGPAINNPALTGDDKTLEGFLVDSGKAADAAIWVSLAVGSGMLGNSSNDAPKGKVVAFLTAWGRRHGKAKMGDLKQKVLAELARPKGKAESVPVEVRQRIDALFDQITI